MPFLDAKALETDPDGMAFLRSVIGGDREQDKPARLRLLGEKPSVETHLPGHADLARRAIREPAAPAVAS